MEIKYRPYFCEFLWFNFYQLPRVLSILILVIGLIVYIGYDNFFSSTSSDYSLAVKIVAFIITLFQLSIICIVFFVLIIGFLQLTNQHQRSQMNHDCKLIVSESGIVDETPTKRTELNWSGIPKISQTRGSILIYVSDSSAFVISKKAFQNEIDAKAFFDYTYNLWQRSKKVALSK